MLYDDQVCLRSGARSVFASRSSYSGLTSPSPPGWPGVSRTSWCAGAVSVMVASRGVTVARHARDAAHRRGFAGVNDNPQFRGGRRGRRPGRRSARRRDPAPRSRRRSCGRCQVRGPAHPVRGARDRPRGGCGPVRRETNPRLAAGDNKGSAPSSRSASRSAAPSGAGPSRNVTVICCGRPVGAGVPASSPARSAAERTVTSTRARAPAPARPQATSRLRRGVARAQHQVAAVEPRPHVLVAELARQLGQPRHRHPPLRPEVHAPQESDIRRHRRRPRHAPPPPLLSRRVATGRLRTSPGPPAKKVPRRRAHA